MFQTTHKLDFFTRLWDNPWNDSEWQEFKIGTCIGQWVATENTYDILTVINTEPGNGHLDDVFEWFEQSCKRDGRYLRVLEIINEDFAIHLVKKRGFHPEFGFDLNNVVKRF